MYVPACLGVGIVMMKVFVSKPEMNTVVVPSLMMLFCMLIICQFISTSVAM